MFFKLDLNLNFTPYAMYHTKIGLAAGNCFCLSTGKLMDHTCPELTLPAEYRTAFAATTSLLRSYAA